MPSHAAVHELRERRLLQGTVAVLALVPIGAGCAGVILGPAMVGGVWADVSLDSHFRYLSGLLLALGIGFWSTVASIEAHTGRFRLLTLLVFTGGLARLFAVVLLGLPSIAMLGGLAMELVVTPILCLWQARVARRAVTPQG